MPTFPPGRVLVAPAAVLDRLGRFQGLSAEVGRYLDALLAPGVAEFRPRAEVEEDPSYKQIIPYVVFRSAAAVFAYRRGASQVEAELERLRALGVGLVDVAADAERAEPVEASFSLG